MSTTKSEGRKSRRSSILKAPKARQPLQNVELNASSVENSPTTSTHKIKRRVSFAEKKHVKEFCDSMEQGTVWDNTYEESELSHRNSQNSNDENTASVEFPSESSKSRPGASIASATPDESVVRDSTFTGPKSLHSTSSAENPSIPDLNPPPAGCDPAIEDSVFGTAPTRIPYPTNHFGSIKARRSLSTGDCERNAFDEKSSFRTRANTCPTIDSRTRQVVRDDPPNSESATEAGEDRNVVPMEETTIGDPSEPRPIVEVVPRASIIAFVDENSIAAPTIPSAGPIVDSKLEEEIARTSKVSVEHEKFTIFHDTSMEITEAVSNLTMKKSSAVESREESSVVTEITTSGTKTVEFRETVSETVLGSTRASIMEFVDENPIGNVPKIPSAGRMVDSKLDMEIAQIAKNSVEHEKFTIFHDTSMEITEAVSNLAKKKSLFVESREQSSLVTTESTMFGTKTMEFTETVRKIVDRPSVDGDFLENARKSLAERTKIFDDKSVDFTEIVGNVAGIENLRKSPTERTKIFHDKSMEFTDALGNVRFTKQRENSPTERTKIFHDKSMEFTDALGNVRITKHRENSPTERTKIFHDKSMEFTDALGNVRFMKQRENSPTERTRIFHDESVDFTNIVGNAPGIENPPKSPTERTKIFHDKSMELTAVQDVRIAKQGERSAKERTKIFHDESIDFTEVVGHTPGIQDPRKSQTDRTTIFNDQSVDFTNIVGSIPGIENPQRSQTERTTLFHEKSMEFTEVVENVRNTKQRQKSQTEKTKIFHNETVDFTEVVQNLADGTKRESSPGRSSIFRTESLEQPEREERNILQNRQPHEVPEVVQKILRAPTLDSRESPFALDVRMAIVAKTFVPAVQKPRSEDPEPEVRPPLPKRMKSIGNKSTDLTAAVSFIKLGGKKTQPSDESSDDGSTLTPETIDDRLSERTADFRNQSMEATEVVAGSQQAHISFPSAEEVPIFQSKSAEATFAPQGSGDCDDEYRMQNTTLLGDESMEMTGVIPGIVRAGNIEIEEHPKTTIFHDQSMEMTVAVSRPANENEAAHWSDPTKFDHDGKTVLFRDDRMELTGAVGLNSQTEAPFVDQENCPVGAKDFCARGARLVEHETKTTVFRDDSMDLTEAVRPASNCKERRCMNEAEAVHWSDPRKFDHEGKTVFFGDDRMELTGAVGFNSRANVPFANKENCPVGAEDFRPRGARLFEDESRIASKSEWLGKRKSSRSSSSQRSEEKLRDRAESEEQNRVENFGSDEVTGVVAFSSQIDDNEYEGGAEERGYRISGNDSGTLILGNESLEMTGVVPWSSDLDVNRLSRPPGGTDDLPIVDKIHQRSSQSQVVKELFQKPISSHVYAGEKIEPASVNERTGTADLEAEIRKLAESFALEDESGFDQATFLRQQARCMEDYEANSTASQDCEPPAQSVTADGRPTSDESSDSEKSDNWERSPSMKNANASGRDVSAAESQCFSSKSLEELRNRAYSVGKFQPEATGYELTAAISLPSSDDFHRTIMLEDLQAVEPPSFLGDLADSMRSAPSVSELPTESEIAGRIAEGEMRRAGQAISQIWQDIPNVSLDTELTIPDITETVNMVGIVEEKRSENTGERMERKKMHRTQTCEINESNYDLRISGSPSEINDERAMKHRRSSTGLTTADEFSSQSVDGPSEKLRRGESLPTEGKVEKSTKFTDIDRSWDSKNFASSTVIVDDFTRQMIHRFVEESAVVLQSSLSDELPSVIDGNEEENVGRSARAEETACQVAMEAEASLRKSPFDALQEIVKNLAERSETIWTIMRFDEKMLVLNFFSNSIVLAIHFNETSDANTKPIRAIGFLSQLVEEGTDPGVSLAHSLIMKKVNSASLTHFYRTYEDIPQMLDFVTTEVKLGMDFMFELDRLRNRNVMEIYGNRIMFMVRTSDINAGIILKLTMEIKPFAEINSNDIKISCILGSDKVRDNDIKRLITNIKRDHRFLRFYMSDVKDYVDLMAETGFSAPSGTGCD